MTNALGDTDPTHEDGHSACFPLPELPQKRFMPPCCYGVIGCVFPKFQWWSPDTQFIIFEDGPFIEVSQVNRGLQAGSLTHEDYCPYKKRPQRIAHPYLLPSIFYHQEDRERQDGKMFALITTWPHLHPGLRPPASRTAWKSVSVEATQPTGFCCSSPIRLMQALTIHQKGFF